MPRPAVAPCCHPQHAFITTAFLSSYWSIYPILPLPPSPSPPLSHLHRQGTDLRSPHRHQSFHATRIPPLQPHQQPDEGWLLWGPFIMKLQICFWVSRFSLQIFCYDTPWIYSLLQGRCTDRFYVLKYRERSALYQRNRYPIYLVMRRTSPS